ncbi:U2 small nuclear ribonucleoprotein auxiliary factor 35 kDa subunit-related protein 2 [Etheostoma cragini]|uniref:U2 small nuclear ribonucleoprotein auxiliary factor 35 kDa subunit-related protein 2 n=1 Tax=Etheostoma cragini TaxID=417921 RepID=UPI00155E0B8D|nr:U2 small nuclear ribonucleoprotein auxiliary factor 35 kDa subunit-related protein 2 [Etheostoma cragini]
MMAAPAISATVFSQKQRRAALRKERRKRKRQALAQARECGLKIGASCTPEEEEEEEEERNDENEKDYDVAEQERLQLHEEWLERERLAQEEFRMRAEREESARKRKEEEERMIKEEWEAQQKKEQDEKEQKQQDKRDREEAVQKMLDEAKNQLENGEPWMNPEAPVSKNSVNFGTERDVANCPFFLKTGACRFGDRCSRKHVYPTASPTLMIRGMFTTFGMEQSRRDDYDVDACLEHSEEELQESFLEFYHDVVPELKSVGKVVQFKVSCNYEPHLRGNVYIQFDTEEQCKEAIIKFNGRWYAGRQLHCEMCPVTRWKNAICGLFDRQKCPKGKHCNFLHVFRNPGNEFWEADRDLHMSPDGSVRGSRRDGWHSERYGDRSWRQRQRSRSPPRSHSRRESDRRRSRETSREMSRETRASQQYREDKRSSRHSDSRKDWYRSRDRSRSQSRDREQDTPRNRSRDKDREHKYKNRSEKRASRDKDTDTHRARERSKSTSRERKKQSGEMSPQKPDTNEKPTNEGTNTRRRHKQSKKSKKKSKKKHKKKSHLPEVTTSSGESEKEEESEEKTVENLTATSPIEEIKKGLEFIQEKNDVDESPCVDCEMFSPEVKIEQSNTGMPSEAAGKVDRSTS